MATCSGYLLGVDVGTTSTKAVVYEPAAGRVVAVASRPTAVRHPRPEWSEFDPAEIWRGIVESIREVTAGRAAGVRAVGVASMAEAGVPVDRAGRCLYPIIAWHDPRTEPQASRWVERPGPRRVFEITGQTIQAKFSVNKLLWLREHAPEAFRSIHRWLCVEDFALWKLAGVYATDHSIASRTLAFDQRRLRWSEEMLGLAGLPADLFPSAYPSGTTVGQVTPEAAAETGLPTGAAVVTGGHDHLCGSLAAGVVGPGTLLDSMGTAEGGLLLADRYDPDERLLRSGYCHYAHVIPGQYVILFGLTASGGMLEWLVRQLWPEAGESAVGRDRAFAAALAAAEGVPPGSSGVFWLPHLSGIGSPWEDERSKAGVVGLTPAHGRGHLVRALLEGLSYWLRENLDALGEIVAVPRDGEIIAIGGGTRAALWMRIKADVTGRAVRVVEVPEAAALGAALLAGVGVGTYRSAEEAAASVVRPSTTYEPDPARRVAYDRCYRSVYRELYPALRSVNQRIHELFWLDSSST